jgi:hypothetical protein
VSTDWGFVAEQCKTAGTSDLGAIETLTPGISARWFSWRVDTALTHLLPESLEGILRVYVGAAVWFSWRRFVVAAVERLPVRCGGRMRPTWIPDGAGWCVHGGYDMIRDVRCRCG